MLCTPVWPRGRHVDRWHRASCLLQAAWLVWRGLIPCQRGPASSKSNCITPHRHPPPPLCPALLSLSPSLSAASASLKPPSVCWSGHMKTRPSGIWTRAAARLAGCTGAWHYVSCNTCHRNPHIFMYAITAFMHCGGREDGKTAQKLSNSAAMGLSALKVPASR